MLQGQYGPPGSILGSSSLNNTFRVLKPSGFERELKFKKSNVIFGHFWDKVLFRVSSLAGMIMVPTLLEREMFFEQFMSNIMIHLYLSLSVLNLQLFLADLKNQPIASLCVTHSLQFYGYFKGQEQSGFNPTCCHLVTYNLFMMS